MGDLDTYSLTYIKNHSPCSSIILYQKNRKFSTFNIYLYSYIVLIELLIEYIYLRYKHKIM